MFEKVKSLIANAQITSAVSARYQNVSASGFISDTVRIGQATADEKGGVKGGKAGDQTGGEVSMSNWSYSSGDNYNTWNTVFRAKDASARLRIAQAAIDACNNNHIGYDQNSPDRKSCFKVAQKVGFDLSKITTDCELTCSELANVCIAAAGLKSYLPENKMAYVDSLRSKLKDSSEFVRYTVSAFTSKNDKLIPGDIIMSDGHTAIVVKTPKRSATKSVTTVAQEVIDGKWGSGDARKIALESFGYDYNAVQKKVNEIIDGGSKVKPTSKYTGEYPVVKRYLEKGDKGTEVTKLQNYLNWYTCGEFFEKCGKADGVYGNNTLKYVKQMQTDFFSAKEADGTVGPKTIAKMKAYSDSIEPAPQPTPTPGTYTGSYPTDAEIYDAQIGGMCQACRDQTSWAYDSIYKYESHPTIEKSKTHGTCVTYVSCVLQRTGVFSSGSVLWHNGSGFGDGKVYGTNNQMTLTYYNNKKTLNDLSLKTCDILFYDDNKSGESGNGGHIEIFNGTKKNGKFYFYSGGTGSHHNTSNNNSESGSRKVLAVVRIKSRGYLKKNDRGTAITKLQNYLDWYFDGAFFKACGGADGVYGTNTETWVKKMQTDFFGAKEADGTVGPKTIAKMKAVKK